MPSVNWGLTFGDDNITVAIGRNIHNSFDIVNGESTSVVSIKYFLHVLDINVDLLPTLTIIYIIHGLSQNSCVAEFILYITCIIDYYWSEMCTAKNYILTVKVVNIIIIM